MNVYLLRHKHWIEEDNCDWKFLGVYSSNRVCEEAITKYKLLPGFSELPTNFEIDKCEIIGEKRSKKPAHVFLVYHTIPETELDSETESFIGACASKKDAILLISKNRELAPYNRFPGGFSAERYPVGFMYWVEGYDTCDVLESNAGEE